MIREVEGRGRERAALSSIYITARTTAILLLVPMLFEGRSRERREEAGGREAWGCVIYFKATEQEGRKRDGKR